MKNPFQPFRDILPWYPFCIRTFLLMSISLVLIIFGAIIIEESRSYYYSVDDTDNCYQINSVYVYCDQKREKQESDKGGLAGGSIMIIFGVPMLLTSIFLYYFLGCGYNRFYTNNLVKFEGRGAVKKARKARNKF